MWRSVYGVWLQDETIVAVCEGSLYGLAGGLAQNGGQPAKELFFT